MAVVGAPEMIEIKAEQPQHFEAIESLLDSVFGADRRSKAVYNLRQGVSPIAELCHVALVDGELHGSIRYWPIALQDDAGRRQADLLLLGPLAVDPVFQGAGLGRALVEYSLILAERRGYRAAILVGDAAYYSRFRFDRSGARGLNLPGEADQERVLMREIVRGAPARFTGTLVRASMELAEHCPS
jgi:predicted N-acetyltransferase YhbS